MILVVNQIKGFSLKTIRRYNFSQENQWLGCFYKEINKGRLLNKDIRRTIRRLDFSLKN